MRGAIVLLVLCGSALAHAGGLEWEVPAGCPSAAVAEHMLAKALSDSHRHSAVTALVQVSHERGRWRARIETRIGGVIGRRELSAGSCADVAQAAVLVIAMAAEAARVAPVIGPRLKRLPKPRSKPRPAPEAAPVSAGDRAMLAGLPAPLPGTAPVRRRGPVAEVAQSQPPPTQTEWSVAVMVSSDAGISPGPEPAVGMVAGFEINRRWRVSLGASYSIRRNTELRGRDVGAEVAMLTEHARGCAVWSSVRTCLGIDIGQLFVASYGVDDPGSASELWFGAVGGVEWVVWGTGALGLLVGVDAIMSISRPRFVIVSGQNYKIYGPSIVGARGKLAGEIRF